MTRTNTILGIACIAAILTASGSTVHAQHGNRVGRLACLADQQVGELEAAIEYELCRVPERHAMKVHTQRMHWLARQIQKESGCRGRTHLLHVYTRELEIKRDVIETLLNCVERRLRIPVRHHGAYRDVPDTRLIRHMLCQLDATLEQLSCPFGQCGSVSHVPQPHVNLYEGPSRSHTGIRIGQSGGFGLAIRLGH
jgi:hypothetical protein